MTEVVRSVQTGFVASIELLRWSLAFFARQALLILGVSVVPTVIRVVQVSGNDRLPGGVLDAVVLVFRAALYVAVIAAVLGVQIGDVINPANWLPALKRAWAYGIANWHLVLWQVVWCAVIFVAINAVVPLAFGQTAGGIRMVSPNGAQAQSSVAGEALQFVVRNAFIIPLYVIYFVGIFRPAAGS